MAMNGTDILLLVNTGTPGVPTYEVVGSQRDVTFEEADAGIDISSKDSRAARVLPGRYSATISLDALYVPTDAAYQSLKDALRAGDLIQVLRQENGVSLETATARIDSMSEAGPDQGEATVSIALTIDGEWTEVGT
jgi:TP901-1 family phage major tail protein